MIGIVCFSTKHGSNGLFSEVYGHITLSVEMGCVAMGEDLLDTKVMTLT